MTDSEDMTYESALHEQAVRWLDRFVRAHPNAGFTVSREYATQTVMLGSRVVNEVNGALFQGRQIDNAIKNSLHEQGAMLSQICDLLVVGSLESIEAVRDLFFMGGASRFLRCLEKSDHSSIFSVYATVWPMFFGKDLESAYFESQVLKGIYRCGELW